jgi:7,8-dihydropterin-6-yl-methyl-4-(beta-D-ribofuranosyl)aminobenzene 5'-phosphate synthase
MSDKNAWVDSLKVTVLMDDYAGYDNPYLAQHGLAFFVEVRRGEQKTCILLDTGQTAEPLLHNMKLTGVSPGDIDLIFLSHCHYDHTGGLAGILAAIGRETPVVAHPLLFRENYSLKPRLQPIGMRLSRQQLEALGGRPVLAGEPFSLLPGVTSSGEVKRSGSQEGRGIGTYNLEDGSFHPDPLRDDLSLYVNVRDRGLFILTGCSHAGILDILRQGLEVTGVSRVLGLMGGLHLLKTPPEEVEATVAELARYEPEYLWAGHCTGLLPLARLAQVFPRAFAQLQVGRVLQV